MAATASILKRMKWKLMWTGAETFGKITNEGEVGVGSMRGTEIIDRYTVMISILDRAAVGSDESSVAADSCLQSRGDGSILRACAKSQGQRGVGLEVQNQRQSTDARLERQSAIGGQARNVAYIAITWQSLMANPPPADRNQNLDLMLDPFYDFQTCSANIETRNDLPLLFL